MPRAASHGAPLPNEVCGLDKAGGNAERPSLGKVLFVESGSGLGGSSSFLLYSLKYLDRKTFEPLVAYCFTSAGSTVEHLQRLGVPVFFLSPKPHPRLESLLTASWRRGPDRIRVFLRWGLRLFLTHLPQLLRLVRLIRREGIALVVLNNDVHYHLPGVLAARLCRVPCVCRKAGGIGEGKRIKRLLTPLVDLFIAVSTATALDQATNNPGTRRLVTLAEGIDLAQFDPALEWPGLRQELGIPDGRKIVGSISRLHPGKGQKQLIEAAAVVVSQFSDVAFLLVGDEIGPGQGLRRELERRVRELGLGGHVIFTGWREDVERVLSVIDVFVHCPTTFVEGLCLANLEAMAMAKPTIVSNNGGLPDAVLDGVTGYVVTPDDPLAIGQAILRLLRDDTLGRELGRNGRIRVEAEFHAEKNTRQMESLFRDLLQRSDRRPLSTLRV